MANPLELIPSGTSDLSEEQIEALRINAQQLQARSFPYDPGPPSGTITPGVAVSPAHGGNINDARFTSLEDFNRANPLELISPQELLDPNDLSGGTSPRGALEARFRQMQDSALDELRDELGWQRRQQEKQFGRDARAIAESFGDRIGMVNAQIGDAKEELSTAEESYMIMMDSIAPGFADAVDKAKRAAKATAAIEATFTGAQEDVDAAYASASGRVRALADAVGAAGNQSVANAINETVFEMKTFIDQQIGLDRNQTITMHGVAAQMAAAAAEAEHANVRGEAATTIYKTQGKYEKILTNLVRQRSLLNAQRQRAERDLAEARADFALGQRRAMTKEEQKIRDSIDPELLAANVDLQSFKQVSGALTITRFNEDPATRIDPTQSDNLIVLAIAMQEAGFADFGAFLASQHVSAPNTPAEFLLEGQFMFEDVMELVEWEDQLEVLAKNMQAADDDWRVEMSAQPSSLYGQYGQAFRLGTALNLSPRAADQYAQDEVFANNGFGLSDL
jgi:hypothetical protein